MSTLLSTFTLRLEKSAHAQRKDEEYPIVLQVTYDRKSRKKGLGIFAHGHPFNILKDLRKKKERVELSDMHGVGEAQEFIDSELELLVKSIVNIQSSIPNSFFKRYRLVLRSESQKGL